MATEMTPQERAAVLLDRIVGIIPMQPSQREARIVWLVEYAAETRRAALLEAAEKARERSKRQRNDCESRTTHMLRTDEAELIAYALDRLAQEG